MTRRMMLYNTVTRKWEWWTVGRPLRMPWEGAWTRMRWLARYARRHGTVLRYGEEAVYDFDPVTLDMRDPKRERRMRRRERRDRIVAKMANALNSMVEMQKHLN